MIFFSRNYLTLFTISIILCIGTVAGMRTHTWTHNFFNYAEFVQDNSFLRSPGQVYGACEENLVHVDIDRKFSIFCTFIMEMNYYKPIDKEGHVRSCNFSLDTNLPKYHDTMFMVREIEAVTMDKAVLKLDGLESFLILFLDFADCKVVGKLQNDYPMTVYSAGVNKIDVVMSHKRNFEKKSRVTLKLNNMTDIKEKEYWFDTTSATDSIKAILPSITKHRILVDVHGDTARVYAVDLDGSNETLKCYPIEKDDVWPRHERVLTSTTYGHLTVCPKMNNTWSCAQFDMNGNLKFETNITLEDVHRLAVRNLEHGGFLLLIAKCDKERSADCLFSEKSFVVEKYDASGQLKGTLNIDNPTGEGYKANTHVFRNEKKELCLSDVHKPEHSDDLKLQIICLTDDDFDGKITWPTN